MMLISKQFYAQRDAEGACNVLVREAADRWQAEQGMVDDITIVIAFLNVGSQTQTPNPEEKAKNFPKIGVPVLFK
jgi:hypothetical protein